MVSVTFTHHDSYSYNVYLLKLVEGWRLRSVFSSTWRQSSWKTDSLHRSVTTYGLLL